jgi:hypothetical protein
VDECAAGNSSAWAEAGPSAVLTREQFELAKQVGGGGLTQPPIAPRRHRLTHPLLLACCQAFGIRDGPITQQPQGGGPGDGAATNGVHGETIPLEAFVHWAEGCVSDEQLGVVLAPLAGGPGPGGGDTPQPQAELRRVADTLAKAVAAGGGQGQQAAQRQAVYLIASAWWHAWCDYAAAPEEIRGATRPGGPTGAAW